MISVEDAWALILSNQVQKQSEIVPIAQAIGRTLSADVTARVSRPSAAVSAMDGYAVRLNDVSAPNTRLKVIGAAPAGHPFSGGVAAGQAVRIFTGGEMPDGADHVIIQENATTEGEFVHFADTYTDIANVREAGRDFREGDVLLKSGHRIGAPELTLLAASNHADIPVTRKLKVGLLANGDELRPPGSTLERGQLINSNVYGLAPLIEEWGAEAIDLGIASDSLEAIREKLAAQSDIDIFVPIGGASVGDHDHMKAAFDAEGFSSVFRKIAVRPGKPTWFSAREHQRVLGLPGNPASALVCAHLFLKPLIGGTDLRFLVARLQHELSQNGPREHYMRAHITLSENGQLEAKAARDQDSSLIGPFLTCKALLRLPPNAGPFAAGDTVSVLPTGNLF